MSDQGLSHEPVAPGTEPEPAEGTTHQPELPLEGESQEGTPEPQE